MFDKIKHLALLVAAAFLIVEVITASKSIIAEAHAVWIYVHYLPW